MIVVAGTVLIMVYELSAVALLKLLPDNIYINSKAHLNFIL